MIRILRPAVAASIQDRGRFGHRWEGYSRSGAMDPLSVAAANRLAGADPAAAAAEFGPGPCVLEATRTGTIAFGGARREGAPWWKTIEVEAGQTFELSPPRDGVWSYLAIEGGVEAPVVLGSRSTQVREGIGRWIEAGDLLEASTSHTSPEPAEPPPMAGEIRLFGTLPGEWRVGTRIDRMGYQLDGQALPGGRSDEWSESLLPGCVQLPPSGIPIVLMAEGPTVGGYKVVAVVHSEDLRLVAQTPIGGPLRFVPA